MKSDFLDNVYINLEISIKLDNIIKKRFRKSDFKKIIILSKFMKNYLFYIINN